MVVVNSLNFVVCFRKLTPVVVRCGVEGCTNMKKYCCSRTGMPLCSLECYHKNIATIQNSGQGNHKL
jgi:INO80 complex subunit B